MPNWCWNHLEVTGDKKQLQEFVEKSENCPEGSEFTFNGTHPMPEEFKEIKTGSYTDENGVSYHKWREVDGKNIPVSDKDLKQLKENLSFIVHPISFSLWSDLEKEDLVRPI